MNLKCHCGNVKISFERKPESLTSCNCSLCNRYGALWSPYKPEEVSININSVKQNTYSHGDKNIDFNFCSKCGCITHYTTTEKVKEPFVGINFRMADLKDMQEIKIKKFDGADTWKFID